MGKQIETEFVEVIGLRQSHKAAFDKSDLFFLCVLRPRTFTIIKQDSEVLDAKVYVVIRECCFLTRIGKHLNVQTNVGLVYR